MIEIDLLSMLLIIVVGIFIGIFIGFELTRRKSDMRSPLRPYRQIHPLPLDKAPIAEPEKLVIKIEYDASTPKIKDGVFHVPKGSDVERIGDELFVLQYTETIEEFEEGYWYGAEAYGAKWVSASDVDDDDTWDPRMGGKRTVSAGFRYEGKYWCGGIDGDELFLKQIDLQETNRILKYSKAWSLNPKSTVSDLNLGIAYAFSGELELALQYLGKYLELNPNAPDRANIQGMIQELKSDIAAGK